MDIRQAVGPYGIWRTNSLVDGELAGRIEELGFGSLWVGGMKAHNLDLIDHVLGATSRLVVASGVLDIFSAPPPSEVAAVFRRLDADHPGRFVLGLGVSHPEHVGVKAARPVTELIAFIDELDREGVPRSRIVLAALGDRMLGLARDRAAGAHPYLVTPAHTEHARTILGPAPLLVPEQRVLLEDDRGRAREVARERYGGGYLRRRNYRRSLNRQGFTDEEIDTVADRLLDALLAIAPDARARIDAHLDRGADHVAVQLVDRSGREPFEELALLARVLGLPGRTA